jgi:Ca2+-binding RTX toxin-like protein
MANFVFSVPRGFPTLGNQTEASQLLDLAAGLPSASASEFVLSGSALQLTLGAATNFDYATGLPNGTVSSATLSAFVPEFGYIPVITGTGLAVDAMALLDALRDQDSAALNLLLYSGADSMTGGSGQENMVGFAGNDTIDGGEGDDLLSGGAGDDSLFGGDGNDEVAGGAGNDVLDAGDGNDFVSGGRGADLLNGGEGNDTFWGGDDTGADTIIGGGGNDSGAGGGGRDLLDGGSGNDTLFGDFDDGSGVGGHADTLYGGDGDDLLLGLGGRDRMFGDAGNDILSGGAGEDFLQGGAGADTMIGGSGADRFTFVQLGDFSAQPDVIGDFRGFEGDLINLRALDANATRAGNQNFAFNNTGAIGTVSASAIDGGVLVSLFMDSVAGADGAIFVLGATSLTAADFIL